MSGPNSERVSAVLAQLDRVTDPELDESVTELGFVTDVEVDAAGRVQLGFRLPTYWCAANFAFLMADDMRRAIAALPWVTSIALVLGDHMYADTINGAMQTGQSFQEAFAEEADGDLDEIRQVFDMKAFQRRQLALLDHLHARDFTVPAILGLTIAGLSELELGAQGGRLVIRYLERRDRPGATGSDQPAFVTVTGHAVTAAFYDAHRRTLRRVAVSGEFNGALCRGLLAARFGEIDSTPANPTLQDFVRGYVPPTPTAPA